MKRLDVHRCKVSEQHLRMVEDLGSDSLDANAPDEFYVDGPLLPGSERVEDGSLISVTGNISPHTDTWLGRGNPRKQRSLFWLIKGAVQMKVDGYKHVEMRAGDFVVFDHRMEHLVMADGAWLGAAWQISTCSAEADRKVCRA